LLFIILIFVGQSKRQRGLVDSLDGALVVVCGWPDGVHSWRRVAEQTWCAALRGGGICLRVVAKKGQSMGIISEVTGRGKNDGMWTYSGSVISLSLK
jgi:hypothetical protein